MIEAIESFITNLFGGNAFLATFFISMIPMIEIKGAIPFGMSTKIFGKKALPPFSAWGASAVGALVPALLLVWLFIPIMNWLKSTKFFRNVSLKLEQKFSKNAENIAEKAKDNKKLKKVLGLILFVAIPLPLTGVYTGSAIAGYLRLGYLNSILTIFFGNVIAGGIVVLLCTIFKGYEIYVFMAFLVALLIAIIISTIRKTIKRKI